MLEQKLKDGKNGKLCLYMCIQYWKSVYCIALFVTADL